MTTITALLTAITEIMKLFIALSKWGKIGIIVICISFFIGTFCLFYKLIKKKITAMHAQIDILKETILTTIQNNNCDHETCFDKFQNSPINNKAENIIESMEDCRKKLERFPEYQQVKELTEANIKLGLAVNFLTNKISSNGGNSNG